MLACAFLLFPLVSIGVAVVLLAQWPADPLSDDQRRVFQFVAAFGLILTLPSLVVGISSLVNLGQYWGAFSINSPSGQLAIIVVTELGPSLLGIILWLKIIKQTFSQDTTESISHEGDSLLSATDSIFEKADFKKAPDIIPIRQIEVDRELMSVCREIAEKGWDEQEWLLHDASDFFQAGDVCCGYDAKERDFTFSKYQSNGEELWFQLSLQQIHEILKGEMKSIPAAIAEEWQPKA